MRVYPILTTFFTILVIANGKCNSRKKREAVYHNGNSYHNYGHVSSTGKNYSNNYDPLNYPPKCKTPPNCINPNALNVVDISWMTNPRLYYVTAGGCTSYSNTANVLLARSARTVRELNEMCLSVFFYGNLYFWDGYGRQFLFDCTPLPNGGGNCIPDAQMSDTDTDTSILIPKQVYPVLTDNQTFTVYIRCYNNQLDVVTITTEPFLEEDVVTKTMDVADQYGYPRSELLLLPCKYPIYPVPFQAYLQQSGPYNPNQCYSASA